MIITCGICGDYFANIQDCGEHEKTCKGKIVKFKCGICGNEVEYYETLTPNPTIEMIKAQCHVLPIDSNYGSKLPAGSKIKVCDECAYEYAEMPEIGFEEWT